MRWWLALLVGLGMMASAASAKADVAWLCAPDQGSNPCVGDLTTTAPRTGEVTRRGPATDPKVDCFYVYPTVSSELGAVSSKAVTPELRAMAELQAAQFSRVCDVYAPVYRQVPVLQRDLLGAEPAGEDGYADVAEAFETYARAHPQRGFVLLGHAQGATLLRALIRREIDPDPQLRRRLVSAYLPGANVLTDDFVTVSPCERRGEAGCVAAWSTYNAAPPGDARFGRPTGSGALGLPTTGSVVCVNPALLDASRGNRLSSLTPSRSLFPGLLGLRFLQLYGGSPPNAGTPWVRPVDRYTGRCEDGVLRAEPIGEVDALTPAPDASWGLHLLDFNLALGNLVGGVRAQVRGYRAVHLRVRRRGARIVVRVRTAPGSRVKVVQRLRGRKTGQRTVSAPSGRARVSFPAKRLRHYDLTARRLN